MTRMGPTVRPRVVLELGDDRRLARDLEVGGVFVPGCALAVLEECELIVRRGEAALTLAARVVFVDGTGAGLELRDRTAAAMAALAALVRAAAVSDLADEPATDEPAADEPAADDGGRQQAPTLHERLRGLTLVQQHKLAAQGELSERIILERLYGKNVWEALLRNPRLSGPEVARIARMPALARPLLEVILGNGTWLQLPEIRRALLANPRVGIDQALRLLRMLPRHELKLAARQTAYPQAVRDAAKRMVRELSDG